MPELVQGDATPESVAAEAAAVSSTTRRARAGDARAPRARRSRTSARPARRAARRTRSWPRSRRPLRRVPRERLPAAPPPLPAAPLRGARRGPRHAGRRRLHGPRDVSLRPALRPGPDARSADRRDGPLRRRARPRVRGRREVRREADGGREGARPGARIPRGGARRHGEDARLRPAPPSPRRVRPQEPLRLRRRVPVQRRRPRVREGPEEDALRESSSASPERSSRGTLRATSSRG